MLGMKLIITVLLLIGLISINGADIKGRLLTPEEGCGLTKAKNTKIVGGSEAKLGAWPWMAAIAYYSEADRTFRYKCAGTLITSRHVLTAAHCILPTMVFVRLGAVDKYAFGDGPHKNARLIYAEKYPGYNESEHNLGKDIGVLYLESDVEFTDFIRPICLPINEPIRSQSFVGQNPFAAGWGRTSPDSETSQMLMQVQVSVLDNKLCTDLYNKAKYDSDFSERGICAGDLASGNGICKGDSGGPLMLPVFQNGKFPFYQIGVSAYSMNCSEKDSPDGYVSTQYYVDWIQKMVEMDID